MKLRYQILFSLLLVLALALTGCGNKNQEAPTEEPSAAAPLAAEEEATDVPEPTAEPAAQEADEANAVEATAEETSTEEAPAEAESTENDVVFEAVNGYMSNMPEGYNAVGDIEKFKEILDAGGAVLIDVREPGEYEAGHIPGAVNVPLRTLAQNLDKVPTDQQVMVYCASGHRAAMATASLQSLGYANVRAYPPGWKGWSAAGEEVETEANESETYDVPEIAPELLAAVDGFLSNIPEGWYSLGTTEELDGALSAGASLVDVREPDEFAEGAITDAVNIPIREIAARADEIPADEQSVVYCASGFRAGQSLAALQILGHTGVRSYPPGYPGWMEDQGDTAGVPAEVDSAMASDFDVVAAVDEFLASIPEGYMAVGNIDTFKDAMDNTDVYLVDVRETSEYDAGHIPGAVNIPLRTVADNLDKIPTDQPVFVYCGSGHRAAMAISSLSMLGYDNVKAFPPGWKGWSAAEEDVEMDANEPGSFDMPDVDPEMMAAVAEFLNNIPEGWLSMSDTDAVMSATDAGAFVVDVRQPDEYDAGHIPGAVNIPLRELAASVDEIPTDTPVVTYCASGHRAAMALAALQTMGVDNSRAFPGGFPAWQEAGEEVAVAE